MSTTILRKTVKKSSSALILTALLSAGMLAHADNKKAPAPVRAKSTPAAKPAPSAKTGPNSTGAGAAHSTSGAPSANHPTANSSPAANHPTAAGSSRPSPTPQRTSGPVSRVPSPAFQRPVPNGGREVVHPDGNAMRMRPDGRPADVHNAARNMDIHHELNGGSRVMVERADHSRTMFERGRPGYVQRPYGFHGHDFARRTYFYHGREYSHFYHGYAYRGMYINVYAPGSYYHPAYYGWAYNPWAAPVAYRWGFAASPWYGHYGYFFAPAPVYPTASLWLTDYMISADLQQAYAAHTEGGEVEAMVPAGGGAPMLTPDVKQQIADEVRNQLALENQEAQQNAAHQDIDPGSSGIDRMLNDSRSHVYVVGSALDAEDAAKNECVLSDGDVLSLQSPTPAEATTVNMVVLASKGGRECQIHAKVLVTLDDLQEMQNHMRESVDKGLQELQAKQGKDGIPAAPASAQGQPVQAQYAAIAPPEDPNAATEIQQQAQQADQAEKEVTAESTAPAGQ